MDGELSSSYNPPPPENRAPASSECPHCAAPMPATSSFCPACGLSMRPLPPRDRAAAALAYFTPLPAMILLFLPQFRTRQFVRFNACQSILIWILFFILTVIAAFLSNVAAAIIFLLAGILAALGMLCLWIVLSVKAWQGERFELPWFGALAAKLS